MLLLGLEDARTDAATFLVLLDGDLYDAGELSCARLRVVGTRFDAHECFPVGEFLASESDLVSKAVHVGVEVLEEFCEIPGLSVHGMNPEDVLCVGDGILAQGVSAFCCRGDSLEAEQFLTRVQRGSKRFPWDFYATGQVRS